MIREFCRRCASTTVRVKIVSGAAALVGAVAVVMYAYFPGRIEDQARADLVQRAEGIAEIAGYMVGPALLLEDVEAAEEAVAGALRSSDLAYVVITDRLGGAFVSRSIESGVDDYLSKPLRLAALRAMLDRWTSLKVARRLL